MAVFRPAPAVLLALLALSSLASAADAEPSRGIIDLDAGWRAAALAEPVAPLADLPLVPVPMPVDLVTGDRWSVPWNGAWPVPRGQVPDHAWLERTVEIPAAWNGRRILLEADEVEMDAVVHVDGRRVGELLNPGGEMELTGILRPGVPARLGLLLTRTYGGLSRGADQDPLRTLAYQKNPRKYARLAARGLVLHGVPAEVRVTAVVMQPSWRRRELVAEIDVEAPIGCQGARLLAEIRDQAGAVALRLGGAPVDLPAGVTRHRLAAAWSDPRLWELGEPYLYRCTASVMAGERPIDRFPPVSFGFRELWTEGRHLLMNGHPARWKLHMPAESPQGMELLRGMGFNVFQIQPNENWSSFSPRWTLPRLSERASIADQAGYGLTCPAVIVNRFSPRTRALIDDQVLREQYLAYQERHIRRLANHPSILAWAVSMNLYNAAWTQELSSQMGPPGLGRRIDWNLKPTSPEHVIDWAAGQVRRLDPTRPVFGHEGGATGDIHTRDLYHNWMPLQECEEWLSAWAKDGEVPWSAVELGSPYVFADFFRKGDGEASGNQGPPKAGGEPLVTEFCAMRMGDLAYAAEQDGYAGSLVELAKATWFHDGHGSAFDPGQNGAMEVVQEAWLRITRTWRTYGLDAGALPWTYMLGYGGNPSGGWDKGVFMYRDLAGDPASYRQRPAWANGLYDTMRSVHRPFLAYLAGPDRESFAAKDRQVAAGGVIARSVALIWDGHRPASAVVRWQAVQDGRVLASAEESVTLAPGEIRITPIRVPAPVTAVRSEVSLVLEAVMAGEDVQRDRVVVAVHPLASAPRLSAPVALVDPAGITAAALAKLGVRTAAPAAGDRMLVVGSRALAQGRALPFTAAAVQAGLRVLVCEQDGPSLERFGLRTQDLYAREVFPRQAGSPLLAGLAADDLFDWPGSPTLLPAQGPAREHRDYRGYHWGNRGVVASVLPLTPQAGAFSPVVEGGFDLEAAPLLTWRHGRGSVTFCQLDLSERAAAGEPVPLRLLANLIEDLDRGPLEAQRPAELLAGDQAAGWMEGLGLDLHRAAEPSFALDRVLVVGPGGEQALVGREPAVRRFLDQGGTLVAMGVAPGSWLQVAIPGTRQAVLRAARLPEAHPLLAGIGPGLLRWRLPMDLWTAAAEGLPPGAVRLAGGALVEIPVGRGRVVVSGFDPMAWTGLTDPVEQRVVRVSTLRQRRLHAQLLANLGIGNAPAVAAGLLDLPAQPSTAELPIAGWEILGPVGDSSGKGASEGGLFRAVLPPEQGVDGPLELAGQRCDWRGVQAGAPVGEPRFRPDGFLDSGRWKRLPGASTGIGYARATVTSPDRRRMQLWLGADWWASAWVNGTPVITADQRGGPPWRLGRMAEIELQPGPNRILVKVCSGSQGFGCYATLRLSPAEGGSGPRSLLYAQPVRIGDDPLTFSNW